MYLIHQVDRAADLSKFIFGIYQDKSLFGRYLFSPFEQLEGIFADDIPIGGGDQSFRDNFVRRDIFVMTLFSLGGRSDNRGGKIIILSHTVRHGSAAQYPLTGRVCSPCMT